MADVDISNSELMNEDLWPTDRIARAEAEIAAVKKHRQEKAAADKAATLTAEERERQSMRAFGKMRGVDARRKLAEELGFDVGWND